MSYTPTEWESTDVVTATRLNALEQAVGDLNMSYTPNVWQNGDILTADKMNALEQAVASGGGGGSSDYYEIPYNSDTDTLGKTWQEISDAITAYGVGKVIIVGRTPPQFVSSANASVREWSISVYSTIGGTIETPYYADSTDDYPFVD